MQNLRANFVSNLSYMYYENKNKGIGFVKSVYNFEFGIPYFENETFYERIGRTKMNLFVVKQFECMGLKNMQDTLVRIADFVKLIGIKYFNALTVLTFDGCVRLF